MTSKEAKTHIIDTLNGDMNKEYFINELLPEILKDLNRLEALEKAQELEIENLKFNDNENKYQVAIRVLKEAFIVLGKSDITNTCWFKYLEELEKENQELNSKYNVLFNTFSKQIEEKEKLLDSRVKYIEENKKLKKAIEILKNKLGLYVNDYLNYATINAVLPVANNDCNRLTQQENDLLKEVLE